MRREGGLPVLLCVDGCTVNQYRRDEAQSARAGADGMPYGGICGEDSAKGTCSGSQREQMHREQMNSRRWSTLNSTVLGQMQSASRSVSIGRIAAGKETGLPFSF